MSRPCHVILVDDEEVLRTFMRRVIVRVQPTATVTAVSNAHAALQAFEQHGADLLIADCNMPGMDGITLIRHIRSRDTAVPIVAVSGYVDRERAAMEAGATRFLEKPFTLHQLSELLAEFCHPVAP
jgi:CheY-like chemotaxis protein